jgi:hypothetical protein
LENWSLDLFGEQTGYLLVERGYGLYQLIGVQNDGEWAS